jgi:hypothetical protein
MDTGIYNEIRTQAGKMAFSRCRSGIVFFPGDVRHFDTLLYIYTNHDHKTVQDKM